LADQNLLTLDNTDREQISEDEILSFFNAMVEDGGVIDPESDLSSPLGYGYPTVEEFFDLSSQSAVNLLEDLARQNFLERSLEDRIHVCPECEWYTLNFQEVCPTCHDIDIDIQEVIHHFSCAYVGAWTEFREGSDLVCPKCDEQLRNIGMDYEKPSETYVCNACENVFTESDVQARCLRDGTLTPVEDLSLSSVYTYRLTDMVERALEQGRLYGLDVDSLLFEGDTRMVRREFFLFELDREITRARRYDTELSLVMFWFDALELISTGSRTPDDQSLQEELLDSAVETLRDLDLVCSLERGLGVLLLPETGTEGAGVAARRVKSKLEDHTLVRQHPEVTITAVVGTLFGEKDERDAEEFLDVLHEGLLQTVKDQPGEVVAIQPEDE
jgi:GGDEF domain-containing protein